MTTYKNINKNSFSTILNLIQKRQNHKVLEILKDNFNPDTVTNDYQRTALMISAHDSNVEIFKYLIEELDANVNLRDYFGWGSITYLLKSIEDDTTKVFFRKCLDLLLIKMLFLIKKISSISAILQIESINKWLLFGLKNKNLKSLLR